VIGPSPSPAAAALMIVLAYKVKVPRENSSHVMSLVMMDGMTSGHMALIWRKTKSEKDGEKKRRLQLAKEYARKGMVFTVNASMDLTQHRRDRARDSKLSGLGRPAVSSGECARQMDEE
jgi:hypothetical protein